MSFIKNFLEWFALKPELDQNINQIPPLTKEGQIWWCHIGENIGTEVSGKGVSFTRPCIILTKFSKYNFFVVPCSTKNKGGSWFVKFTHNQKEQTALLNQTRCIDSRRLQNRIGQIDDADFKSIQKSLAKLYKLDNLQDKQVAEKSKKKTKIENLYEK